MERLSQREKEVARLIARGLSDRDIAAELHIEEKTIRNHMSSILRKLDLNNRTQLAIFVLQGGLNDIGEDQPK